MKPCKDSPEFKRAITVQKMRDCDAYTIANLIPSKELMFRAAMGIYRAAKWHGKVAIVCGSGNNAGDGYALACILKDSGISPTLFRISDKFSNDGKYYYDMAISKGVSDGDAINLNGFDIVVDCLLGTGFTGEPRGEYANAIKAINQSGAFVISADINSGLNGDTGKCVLAVKSDLTVSIGYYKVGMFIGDAPSLIKDLVNIDIGIVLI
ncbi:MAG: NAD(P)H-hydrate epimerase [Ruminococcaceae bacterium]|nr:NAD(P)H-hydrate epimerase [Oscillospiraceae bacterium]